MYGMQLLMKWFVTLISVSNYYVDMFIKTRKLWVRYQAKTGDPGNNKNEFF